VTAPPATVAIIGRPNVGKSTLFNRLVGRRQAIVHDQPGITRDRIVGRWLLDENRPVELIDTGGLVPGDDPLGLGEQVMLAIDESDLLLLVVDGKDGLVAADERLWSEVRRRGKPAVLVVNKGDAKVAGEHFDEFYRLGLGDQVLVSAEHGRGISDLAEAVARLLPAAAPGEAEAELPALAIVGRPNVGKSSLLNSLLGQPRVLVSPQPGTTRDPVDSIVSWQDRKLRVIDTAGIRRRSQMSGAAEEIAVLFARRQMQRADVVVLTLDASAGVLSSDLAIAGEAWELGRGVVVAVNKWDLVDDEARDRLELGTAGRAAGGAAAGKPLRPHRPPRRPAAAGRGHRPGTPAAGAQDQRGQPDLRGRRRPPSASTGGRQALAALLRHPGFDRSADLHALRQPDAGPQRHLPAVPGEPATRALRSRWHAGAAGDPKTLSRVLSGSGRISYTGEPDQDETNPGLPPAARR